KPAAMRTEDFLAHHGVARNPFAEEDAQTDGVFKSVAADLRHPVWDKAYGDPAEPATSLVFGEKGAGKTALRLQIADSIARHNAAATADERAWVIAYDDFNPFLDHFADRLPARKGRDAERVLREWRLWDHMDAVMSIAVTDLVDRLLDPSHQGEGDANRIDAKRLRDLSAANRRDLMLLAACYDNSTSTPGSTRWSRLTRRVYLRSLAAGGWFAFGVLVTVLIAAAIGYWRAWDWLPTAWPWVGIFAGWTPWLMKWWDRHRCASRIVANVRSLRRDRGVLRRALLRVGATDLENQPLPDRPRTDDRYELLAKLQGVLRSLGFGGVVVLVDRVDEPHLFGGRVEPMRDFVWSMLDNKFLRQPGIGLKLLLPAELHEHLARADRDFHQRARLDKQNVAPSLDWTAEALADLATARLHACAEEGAHPSLRAMIDQAVSDTRLSEALRSLRTPRHLFKFLFRLIATHCHTHPETERVYRVGSDTFEAVLAVYAREQSAVDRGLASG
ncbi:MAG: hypothetical protein AAF805_07960, partial [Planctomycetota bacterium]